MCEFAGRHFTSTAEFHRTRPVAVAEPCRLHTKDGPPCRAPHEPELAHGDAAAGEPVERGDVLHDPASHFELAVDLCARGGFGGDQGSRLAPGWFGSGRRSKSDVRGEKWQRGAARHRHPHAADCSKITEGEDSGGVTAQRASHARSACPGWRALRTVEETPATMPPHHREARRGCRPANGSE